MAKRGRKSFKHLSDEQKDKLYKTYVQKYIENNEKNALTPMYNKKSFLYAYNRQWTKSKQNVIRTMVQSQHEVTQRQGTAWATNLKNNIKKWKKLDPSDLSEEQTNLINLIGDDKINVRWVRSKSNKAFWAYMNSLNDWGVAIGS